MTRRGLAVLGATLVHLTGIYLFCGGFLLSRRSLDEINTCTTCTVSPLYDRAVIFVIDALRFDFISPDPPLPHSPHHHHVLTLPHELMDSQPSHSFIFQTYVDPPTTTLQRIKALTTGSLSTFVDMGSNFGGSEIKEDSLVAQLARAGKTTAFMGDDTWMSVYPTSFARNLTFPFDSFNVEDLHTVDNGVINNLFPLFQPDAPHWDIIVAHGLGVDHVGHRVGPDHPSMGDKLDQMDRVLRRVVKEMPDRTLLVVLGDHGMDEKGDHGGDGARETSAGLWFYSKGIPIASPNNIARFPQSLRPTTRYLDHPKVKDFRIVQQIDIVPTLALLLGLPIPFNNLGTVIPEMFGSTPRLIAALEINAKQIWDYLSAYRTSASGAELDGVWDELQQAWDRVNKATGTDSFVARYDFMRLALAKCRALWAQFNSTLMSMGLAAIAAGVALVLALFVRDTDIETEELVAAAALALCGAITGAAIAFVPSIDTSPVHSALFLAAISFAATFVFTSRRGLATLVRVPTWSVLPGALHALSLLSNSFVLWEDRMSLFLLASTTLPSILTALLSPQHRLRTRILGYLSIFAVCVRLMAVSTVCREEQAPYCVPTYYARGGSQAVPLWALVLALPSAIALPEAVRRVLAISASDQGPAPVRALLTLGIRATLVIASFCWLLEYAESSLPAASGYASSIRLARTLLSQTSLLVTLAGGGALWYLGPLCIGVRQVHDVASGKQQVSILGFANALGAPVLLFLILFGVVPLWAATQPSGQVMLLLATSALLALLEVFDSTRDVNTIRAAIIAGATTNTTPVEPISRVTFAETSAIALLANLAFFATGHQATLQSIQWKAAFVLARTVQYPWAPIMVALNAFGPLMVFGGMASVLLGTWCRGPQNLKETRRQAFRAALGVQLYFALLLLGSAVSAAALRRHLMVWKVFAPRLMLACAALLAVDVGAVLAVAFGVPRTAEKIQKVFRGVPGVRVDDEAPAAATKE